MNWLMYICGGYLWSIIFYSILNASIKEGNGDMSNKHQKCVLISVILVWVWICWKFIK